MKKKSLLVTIILLLIAVFAFFLTACNNEVGTLETLKNEYGATVTGGGFEKGSILITEEIKADTAEGAAALAAIANKEYDKDVHIETKSGFEPVYPSLLENGKHGYMGVGG